MWKYECKYRRSRKTLCALYARESCIGFMVIFGKSERDKFEAHRHNCSDEVLSIYDASKTHHDGKQIILTPQDIPMFEDFINLLKIKRKTEKIRTAA